MILQAWNCSSEELNERKAMLSKNGKKGLCMNGRDHLKGCIGMFVTFVEGLLFKLFRHLACCFWNQLC